MRATGFCGLLLLAGLATGSAAYGEPAGPAVTAPAIQLAQYDGEARPRRPRVRIYRNDDDGRVYPRYDPGPNAVRDCVATYVQEYRPSGTVITPRMNCYWRPG